MASGKVELLFAMTGEDKLSAIIEKNQKNLHKFSSASRNASADTSAFSMAIDVAVGGWTELNSKIEMAMMGFDMVVGAMTQARDFALLGEKAKNTGAAFTQMTGGAERSAQAMGKLRDTTRGLVDDTTLQQFSNKMLMMGHSVEAIQKSLAAGTIKHLATGDDLLAVSEQIAKAALTGEAETLKGMNLLISMQDEHKKYAATLGTTADKLTLNEKQSVVLNSVLGELETMVAATGLNIDAMSLSMQQATIEMANLESDVQEGAAAIAHAGFEAFNAFRVNEEYRTSLIGIVDAALKESKALEKNAWLQRNSNDDRELAVEVGQKLSKQLKIHKDHMGDVVQVIKEMIRTQGVLKESQVEEISRLQELSVQYDSNRKKMEAETKQGDKRFEAARKMERVQEHQNSIAKIQVQIQRATNAGNQKEAINLRERLGLYGLMIEAIKNTSSAKQRDQKETLLALQKEKALADLRRANWRKRKAQIKQEEKEWDGFFDRLATQEVEFEKTRIDTRLEMLGASDVVDRQRMENKKELLDFELQIERDHGTDRQLVAVEYDQRREELERLHGHRMVVAHIEQRRLISEEEEESNRIRITNITNSATAAASAFASASAPMNELLSAQGKKMDTWQIATVNSFRAVSDVAKIAAENHQNLAKGAPAMISAMGGITQGLIKDKRAEAGILAGMETAAGIVAAVTPGMQWASAGHFAAAALYLSIAGGAGKKSGKGKQSSQGSFGAGGAQGSVNAGGGSQSVTVNVNGFVQADSNQLAVGMNSVLSGIGNSGFIGGSI